MQNETFFGPLVWRGPTATNSSENGASFQSRLAPPAGWHSSTCVNQRRVCWHVGIIAGECHSSKRCFGEDSKDIHHKAGVSTLMFQEESGGYHDTP